MVFGFFLGFRWRRAVSYFKNFIFLGIFSEESGRVIIVGEVSGVEDRLFFRI